MDDILKTVLEKIQNDEAKKIGQGSWFKDSCYLVYEVDKKYYTIVMYDQMSCWLMDESLEEIKKEEISQYI